MANCTFISPRTSSARASTAVCRSISVTNSGDKPTGGRAQALSPEWTPASSMWRSTPITRTSVPSAMASTSTSTASRR